MEMSSVPSALSYALNKVNGVSVNTFNINSLSESDVGSNSIIRFFLPSAGLCDMKTLKLNFNVLGSPAGSGLRFPAGIKHLISKIEVMVGSTVIAQGNNFFGIQEELKAIVKGKKVARDTEHGEMITRFDYAGDRMNQNEAEEYNSGLGAQGPFFSCDLGDICEISPRIIPLDLLGQVEIVIYTSNTNVLSRVLGGDLLGQSSPMTTISNSGLSCDFTIKNASLVANMYSLEESAYTMAISSRIKDQGAIEMYIPQHIAYQQPFGGDARIGVSAMCINKLHAVFRRNNGTYDYHTQGPAVMVAGYASATTVTTPQYGWLGCANLNVSGLSQFRGFIQHYSAPTTSPSYNATQASGMNYSAGVSDSIRFQFKINSAGCPQFQANQSQWNSLTKWANNSEKLDVESQLEYLHNKFVISYPLNLPSNEFERPTLSGLDTRSSSSEISLVGSGNVDTTNYDVLLLAELGTILKVGAGRSLELLN
jgi:hypothetical protein